MTDDAGHIPAPQRPVDDTATPDAPGPATATRRRFAALLRGRSAAHRRASRWLSSEDHHGSEPRHRSTPGRGGRGRRRSGDPALRLHRRSSHRGGQPRGPTRTATASTTARLIRKRACASPRSPIRWVTPVASSSTGTSRSSRETDPTGATTRSTHDRYHRLLSRTDPLGRTTHLEYDADGNLTAVDDQLAGPRRFDLDPAGRVTAVHAPGWTERYAYDEAGNQTEATWPTSGPGQEATGTRAYTGTAITRAGNVRYEHDALGRITLRQKPRLSRKPDTWR